MKKMYLKSNHYYNFRHDKEDPRVVDIVLYKGGYGERMCFHVLYDSDQKQDYVPCSEVFNGNWEIYYK